MLRSAFLLPAASLLAATAAACIWDRDTIRDETRRLPGVFDLITGQFEHHGQGYYEARMEECRRTLGSDHPDPQVRNDMGVALLKLARYEESLEVFRKLEAEDPKRYETLSNMGVLFKKMGRFQEAADYTAKALEVNPEGHLGMRDFYLKMLRWRAERAASPEVIPTSDFVGRPYPEHMRGSLGLSKVDYDRLLSLIRSDKTFVDAYVVLGEELAAQGHLNLAFWSWTRAIQLGHPAKSRIEAWLADIHGHWVSVAGQRDRTLVHKSVAEATAAVTRLLESAAWQKTFESVEGEMIAANPNVQFEDVAAELQKRGVSRLAPSEEGLSKTIWEEIDAQEVAAQAAYEQKVQAAAEAKARKDEARRQKIAAAESRNRGRFWIFGGSALGVMALAFGVMLVRRN